MCVHRNQARKSFQGPTTVLEFIKSFLLQLRSGQRRCPVGCRRSGAHSPPVPLATDLLAPPTRRPQPLADATPSRRHSHLCHGYRRCDRCRWGGCSGCGWGHQDPRCCREYYSNFESSNVLTGASRSLFQLSRWQPPAAATAEPLGSRFPR